MTVEPMIKLTKIKVKSEPDFNNMRCLRYVESGMLKILIYRNGGANTIRETF